MVAEVEHEVSEPVSSEVETEEIQATEHETDAEPTDIETIPSEAEELEESEVIVTPIQTDDAVVQESVSVPKSPIERPKSPYLPSYSVTKIGPGMVTEEDDSEGEAEGSDLGSIPTENTTNSLELESEPNSTELSDVPEVSVIPKLDFETESEVSEASHVATPSSTPKIDPEAGLEDVSTPIVNAADEDLSQETSISPIRTPLVIARDVIPENKSDEITVESVQESLDLTVSKPKLGYFYLLLIYPL